MGANSWYGINLDNGTASNVGDAQLTFEDNNVSFTNETGKDLLLVQLDNKKDDDTVANTIVNPGNAGLTEKGPSGQYLPEVITVTTEDGLRAAAALEGAKIALGSNIKLLNNVEVTANNVTIDGNSNKIYADTVFIQVADQEGNVTSPENSLFTVSGDNVILKNITVETGVKNVHALNLYEAQSATFENVTLNHTQSCKGAPLIVGSSTVTTQNGLKAIAGPNSWYAINLDNKYADAGIKFADKTFTFVNNSGKDLPVIRVDYSETSSGKIVVENPGNANLVVDGEGNYVCDHSKTEIRNNKDATPDSEGYTGDTYCTICGKLLSKGTVVAKVDEHPEIGEAIANGTWGKDEATATPKPATSAAGSTATVTTTNNSIPQTADEMNIGLLMMLLVVSAAGLTGTVLYTRKNKAK